MEPAARDGRVVMAAMDIGWSDIGGWTALIAQVGGTCDGRVVHPGDAADLADGDLAIVWDGLRLAIHDGPGTIRSDNPIAHLVGAAVDRERVLELVARVAALEAHQA
jgi:hypothetical protein